MESHSDVTESTQQEDHSETENNEKQQKSIPYSQKLPFDEALEFSNLNNIEIEKIYNELRKAGKPKFQERFPFPDIKVLARLARRVYKEGTNDKKLADMKMPNGWQLLTTAFNNTTLNGYFGAAYWNPKEQQIVVAHRGTSFKNEGALWTDLEGILNNKTVPQMKSAITFAQKIKVIVEELNKRDDVFLQLSFTGHSLGGWLAQITTLTTKYFGLEKIDGKDLFVKSKTVGYHAHTVAFDSPGCEEMLTKIKLRYDLNYDRDRDSLVIDDLDITTYLAAPNLVNTCNLHVGTLYRVFTEDAPRGNFSEYTRKMHKMKLIEDVFSSDKKDNTREVMDWPLVHKGITERLLDTLIKNKIITMVNSVKGLFTGKEGDPLPRSRHYNQYEYFHRVAESFHQEAEGTKDYNPKPDDKDGYCVIRYQVKEVYKRQHSTNAFTLEELDFLSQYKILRDNPVKKLKDVLNQFGDEAQTIEDALKHFEIDQSRKIISCNSEQELKKLIRYVKYIIRFSPGITSKIKDIIRDDPVWFRVEKLNEPFTGRTKELEKLFQTYIVREKEKAYLVITGLDGVGKSELTLKYVREYYGKDHSIIWINAENEEAQKSSFVQLHKKLRLKSRDEEGEVNTELIIDDVYTYLRANKKCSIFIFDNAENFSAIKKFLPQGLSDFDKVHVVITSRNSNSSEWMSQKVIIESLKLNEFNKDEAITFVKNSLKIMDNSQDEEINSLIQTLHKFPLALQQAVAYIKSMKEDQKHFNIEYNISDYLKEYEKEPKKMLSTGSENEDSNRGVFSTLNMTINKIKATEKFGEEALDMLDIISYFAPNDIPFKIFINKSTNCKQLILIAKPLIKFSIIRSENGMLNVHGLVQQIMKLKIEERKKKNSEATSEEKREEKSTEKSKEKTKDQSEEKSKEKSVEKSKKSEEEVLKKTLQLLTEHIAVCEYNEPDADTEKKEREKKKREKKEHQRKECEKRERENKKRKKEEREKKERDKKKREEKESEEQERKEKEREEKEREEKEHEEKENGEKESKEKQREEKECEKKECKEKESEEKEREKKECKEKESEEKEREKKERKEKERKKRELEKKEREKIELCTPHVVSVWNHAYKYPNLIEEFLIRGKNIKISETDPALAVTYFNFIAAGCKYEIVEEIIKKIEEKYPTDRNKVKKFINTRNNDKDCALHGAAKNGKEPTVKLLVSKGADVNAKRKYGWTPLSLAVYNGHLSIVKYLLENKAKIGIQRTGREYTELHFASINGNVEMVKLLLSKGANEDIPEKDYKPGVNYPEKGDVNVSQKGPKANDSKKDTNAGEKIQKKVPYVNAKDQCLFTALHFAVKNNHLEIIKLLLEDARIDVNAKTEWGRTPLYFAAKAKNLESVKILVNKGADVNAKEQRKNFTPLHWAGLLGNKEITTYLLCREGIEIDAQTTKGNTALHLAAEKGNLQIVEILVQKDADFRIKNNDGKLASDLADENSHEEVKNYIERMSKYGKVPHDQVEQDLGKNN